MTAKKIKTTRPPERPAPKKEASPVAPLPAEKEKPKKTYHLVRGMHDVLPKEERYWQAIYRAAEDLARYFQFGRIETPILEEANLFIRSVGRGTDIVDKEMYVFEDRDGARVALRPEPTAGIARAYISHGLWNGPQPVKLWTWGPMFRHDRPQAGRFRQFWQVDFETLGGKDPAIDAELMAVAHELYVALGLPVEIRVNSLGSPAERERYLTELTNYYRTKRGYLCADCRVRLTRNSLRLLDCKEPQCQPVREEAPQMVDWLEEASRSYFMKTLEYLDELGLPYTLSPYLVRGLDYYTGTVFEIYSAPEPGAKVEEADPATALPAQSALGGGGRYDLLVEDLGGRPTPAAGFGLGIERLVAALKQREERQGAPPPRRFDLFFAHLGEEAKRRTLKIITELRASNFTIAFNFFKGSLKAQLESANSLGVPLVIILGQKEVQDHTVIIRDMESGVQEIVDQKKLAAVLKKRLGVD